MPPINALTVMQSLLNNIGLLMSAHLLRKKNPMCYLGDFIKHTADKKVHRADTLLGLGQRNEKAWKVSVYALKLFFCVILRSDMATEKVSEMC